MSGGAGSGQNTRTIAKNSFWSALDMGAGFVVVFLTSIPIARKFGPATLGYLSFLIFVTRISGHLGMLGFPFAARKYMAEYLGRGEPQMARAIFRTTFRVQAILAGIIAAGGLILVYALGDPVYRTVSVVMVLAIAPMMLGAIPTQTNSARESMKSNIPGDLAGMALYVTLVTLTLVLDWGLAGIAAALCLSRLLEFALKYILVRRWMNPFPLVELPEELWVRLKSFSAHLLALFVLDIIVWDRSDIFFLKYLVKDISQVSYFSLPINLTESVLQVPVAFAGAVGMTLGVQYGRSKKEMYSTTAEAARYMALLALPLLMGMSALSGATIRLLYGSKFLPAIPVLVLTALFALPRSFLAPAQAVMLASERQSFLVRWTLLCSGVNVLLDCLLIPGLGALGAVIASGAAQTLTAVGIWRKAMSLFPLPIDFSSLKKIALSGLTMFVVVAPLDFLLQPWLAAGIGIPLGAVTFFTMLRVTRALNERDRERFLLFRRNVPAGLHSAFDGTLALMIPTSPAAEEA